MACDIIDSHNEREHVHIIFSHNETRRIHIILSDNKRWHAFIT